MKLHYIMVMVLLLCGVVAASAAEPYKTLTALELKAMLDHNEPGLVVVDTRAASEYGVAHIKGAISIPLNDLANNTALLQYPVTDKIVFYCNGFT